MMMTVEFELEGQRFVAINGDPDAERAKRAMHAMLKMSKLDIAALRRAADDVPAS